MSDPAAGKFEMPGGHCEADESPRAAALREWQEETGLPVVDGEWTGTWTSANGIYQGFVYTIPREADLDIFARQVGSDPDGDVTGTETIAWWDPADLPANPAVRAELLADLDAVMAALGCTPDCCGAECCTGGCCNGAGGCTCGTPAGPSDGAESVCPCGVPVVYDEMNGWQHGDGSVSHDDGESVSDKMASIAKAAGPPKWPGWDLDLRAVAWWAPLLAAALEKALSKAQAERIARAWLADHPASEQGSQGKREAVEAAAAWLAAQGTDLIPAITPLVPGMLADAWLIGGCSAAAMTDGTGADTGDWQPGGQDAARDRAEALGLGAGLGAALMQDRETALQMAAGYMTALGRALVDGAAVGLGAAAIGASLLAALTDPDAAHASVLGLLVIGIGAAALALYLDRKVQQVRWVTDPASNVCPECLANAAGSPYRIENAPSCPAHFKCRCGVTPA